MDEVPVEQVGAEARRIAERVAKHQALEGQALTPEQVEALVLKTTARLRLQRIEEMRCVAALLARDMSRPEIAERLRITEARIRRIEQVLAVRGVTTVEATPEEVILRAFADNDRGALVEDLAAFKYTDSVYASYPAEGRTTGTWDQVVDAAREGLLTEDEFLRVRTAVGR